MTSMFSRLTGGGGSSNSSNKDKKDEDLADTIVAPGSIRGESVFGEDVPFPEAQGTTTDEDLTMTRSDDLNNSSNNNGDDGGAVMTAAAAVVASASPTPSSSSKPKPKSIAPDEEITPGEGELSEEKQEELNQIMSVYDLKRKKHLHEGPHEEVWRNHKKQVFIISFAGKAIYTKYGDENELSGFMAVFSAFIFHAEANHDILRAIIAGNLKIVFLIRGPLYLTMVAKTNEPIGQMLIELSYLHTQITSLLTSAYNKMFVKTPGFDLRPLLGGAEKFLYSLTNTTERDISLIMNAVHCLRISSAVRNTVGSIMQQAKTPDLLFAILLAKDQLVNMVRPKRHLLQPADLHLIVNFITTSTTFKSSESWTPICLPQFNDKGYLHAYVYYITPEVCLLLMSSKGDHFYELSGKKDFIEKELRSTGALSAIVMAIERQHYSPTELMIPGLLHFVYKQQSTHQLTRPAYEAPYRTSSERKRLFRLYQHIHHRANPLQASHKVYYFTGKSETVLAWVTNGFQLYAVFGPLETKPGAIRACNQLLRWIKEEEGSLFILNSPVFA